MPRIIHFELPVDDVGRAAAFYDEVFGWKTQTEGDEGYWLVTTGSDEPGINGAFISTRHVSELVNIVGVESVDKYLKRAEDAGAEIVRPKRAVGNVGFAAYIKDPDGNTVGLFEAAEADA